MDSYDQVGSFQHVDREFAWDYLRVGGDEDDSARDSLLDIHRWDSSTTAAKMDFAIHVLLRYRFMDVVANVLGCDKHPLRKIQTKVHVELPTRVEQVYFMISLSITGINHPSSSELLWATGPTLSRNLARLSLKKAGRLQTMRGL